MVVLILGTGENLFVFMGLAYLTLFLIGAGLLAVLVKALRRPLGPSTKAVVRRVALSVGFLLALGIARYAVTMLTVIAYLYLVRA